MGIIRSNKCKKKTRPESVTSWCSFRRRGRYALHSLSRYFHNLWAVIKKNIGYFKDNEFPQIKKRCNLSRIWLFYRYSPRVTNKRKIRQARSTCSFINSPQHSAPPKITSNRIFGNQYICVHFISCCFVKHSKQYRTLYINHNI